MENSNNSFSIFGIIVAIAALFGVSSFIKNEDGTSWLDSIVSWFSGLFGGGNEQSETGQSAASASANGANFQNASYNPDEPVVLTSPVAGLVAVTSGYGVRGQFRNTNGTLGSRNHLALDMDVLDDSEARIIAAAPGEVVFAGPRGGLGNTVQIRHADGSITQYAHLASIDVALGETVGRAQELGVMGRTGNSTGVHIDFKHIVDGRAVVPQFAGYDNVNRVGARIDLAHTLEAYYEEYDGESLPSPSFGRDRDTYITVA